MSQEEYRRRIDETKAMAEALADDLRSAAWLEGATETDKALAAATDTLLEYYGKKALLIDKTVVAAMMAEIKEWAEDAQDAIQAIADREAARGATDFTSGPVHEASQRFVAASDIKEREMTDYLWRHELATWEQAVTALREIGARLPS